VRSLRPSAQGTQPADPGAFWSRPWSGLLAATAAEVAHPHRGLRLLLAQFTTPIVLILVAATILAMALGDLADGLIILAIIAASAALGHWLEHTAGQAVDALMAQVRVEVEVRRGGAEVPVPAEDVVIGDLLVLDAGDVVPADCLVVRSQGLLVDEAGLTGESYPSRSAPALSMPLRPWPAAQTACSWAPTWSAVPVRRSWRGPGGRRSSGRCRPGWVPAGPERGSSAASTAFGVLL
jgi:Mg2+-importing ATPase